MSIGGGTLGSDSYQYTVPILHLAGRNGLDLDLNLYYNSRLWTIDSSKSTATFNADRDFPSYGFRLGFGYLEFNTSSYVLTEATGSKVQLVYSSFNNDYETADSYVDYNPQTGILRYRDGRQVLYHRFYSSTNLLRPTKITDTNGSYISISYVDGSDQSISSITDTVGRNITFSYYGAADGLLNKFLKNIKYGAQTYSFSWNSAYVLKYNFAAPLAATNSPASSSIMPVLSGITFTNGTNYNFVYGDWGIVNRIEKRSSTNAVRSYAAYDYPTAANALADSPAYTHETISADGTAQAVTTYSESKASNGDVSSRTITDPSGSYSVYTLSTASDPSRGQVTQMKRYDSSGNLLRTLAYTYDIQYTGELGTITTTLDTGQTTQQVFYYNYGVPNSILEYFGGNLVRRTDTTYLTPNTLTNAYTGAHILDRKTQIEVKSYNSNTVAYTVLSRTDYSYDDPGTITTTVTGTGTHDDTGFSSGNMLRGNLTRACSH